MGHFLKRQAYIDLESPINVMSKQDYNKIMNKGLESRQKPSNPSKNSNFVGRVKGLKVFIGNFTYECNFMILEDTTSIINHHLGEVVFGKPFARNTSLVYNQEEGMVTFEKDDEKITFMMPHEVISRGFKRSTAKDAGEAPNKHPDLKTDEKPVDKEDQVFLDELERLKRQEQDANDVAEALRKEFAQETEELLLQAGAAKASSTNIVNTASTSVSTTSPYGGLSFIDLTNPDQDDSEIPPLEEIYANPTDGIFTNLSYDDEGAVADFTNLEPVVDVSPIPTSRINYIHPLTLILGDPQSAVQTRSKVTKSSRAHAFLETASQITRDVVTSHTKTASQDLKTALECTT
ncbi:protein kinase-like domain, concanavalin A-like lectin/glucanase domain protein [Tanacetum coccineum]